MLSRGVAENVRREEAVYSVFLLERRLLLLPLLLPLLLLVPLPRKLLMFLLVLLLLMLKLWLWLVLLPASLWPVNFAAEFAALHTVHAKG